MKLSLTRVLINAALSIVIGSFAAATTGVSALLVSLVVFALGFIPKQRKGVTANAGLLTEVWVADIKENLFFENEFMNLAVDHSSYIGNKIVHIPQAGVNPNVKKNRAELVADLAQRADDVISYQIDNYTTDPWLVKDVEELNISYSKRQSLMGQQVATLGDVIAESTLINWAATGEYVLRTTGDTVDLAEYSEVAANSTATGSRKLLTVRDFARAAAKMDIDKVPKQGRYAILPTALYYNLFSNEELIANRARLGKDEITMGVVGDIHGFKIIYRGTVLTYDADATANNVIVPDATTGVKPLDATDCAGGLFFSKFAVTQALGEIKVFYNAGEARSFGDIMSAEVNHGAHFTRPNSWGRIGIAQAVGA